MQQLEKLRSLMRDRKISALIVPGTDPHASEYIADHWQERKFISAFTGSAGTAVITIDGGCVWTDSRYFLQASEQLKTSGLQLQKEGIIGTLDIPSWLGQNLNNGDSVAVNPQMFSINGYKNIEQTLAKYGVKVNQNYDLIAEVWDNRPQLPTNAAFLLDEKYTGASTSNKLELLRSKMKENNVNTVLLTALDDIAWLFNLRGSDIECNPTAIAYAVIYNNNAVLFISPDKLDEKTQSYLNVADVVIKEYNKITAELKNLPENTRIGVDFNKANFALFSAIPCACTIENIPSIVFKLKAIKNNTEIDGTRRAMIKDGVALTRFFRWLEKEIPTGNVTEMLVDEKLRACRADQENFFCESFSTIAGYAEHGAIVHYRANKESNSTLKNENFFLLDSGGQYFDGTTDITRTIGLGALSPQQKADYTLVLKGHLCLGKAVFPYGTRGTQLDVLARQFLWNNSLQYGHGTGHGVGHFLNVHEGPQSIRMDENPTILEPGMIISNEPGLYRANEYGIRIENLVTVVEKEENQFGKFLTFETLTLFPYDLNAIDTSLLLDEEINTINKYHQHVYETISPRLNPEEQEWLLAKCRKITK